MAKDSVVPLISPASDLDAEYALLTYKTSGSQSISPHRELTKGKIYEVCLSSRGLESLPEGWTHSDMERKPECTQWFEFMVLV